MRSYPLILVSALLCADPASGQGVSSPRATGSAELPIEEMLKNEVEAVRSLRAIAIAQMQCRAMGPIDVDRDGRGEFGTFAELAATSQIRDRYGLPTRGLMSPPILASEWGALDDGVVFHRGYCFAIFLPGPDWGAVAEAPAGGPREPGPWTNGAEERWICYAWPQRYGVSGELAFCVDQDGGIAATSNRRRCYSGVTERPAFGAARIAIADESAAKIDGEHPTKSVDFRTPLAFARNAIDGQFWQFYDISFAETRHARSRDRGFVGSLETGLDADPRVAIPAELRRILSAQVQCRARNAIDTDRDGVGEYGYFAELAGTKPVRTDIGSGDEPMRPSMLGAEFGVVEDSIVVVRGYCFRIVLPGPDGAPLAEARFGGADEEDPELQPDADFAEQQFYCYAWPLQFGRTGRAAYAVDSDGRILVTDNESQRYSGLECVPDASAAFDGPGPANRPLRPIQSAHDGAAWLDQQASSEPPR